MYTYMHTYTLLPQPVEGLKTEYKQEKYYKENFNYLVSIHSNITPTTQASYNIYLKCHAGTYWTHHWDKYGAEGWGAKRGERLVL